MSYTTLFDRYIEPARARPAVWRMVLGIVLMVLVYALVVAAITFGVLLAIGGIDVEWLLTTEAMATPWALLWVLSTFLGMLVAPMVAVRLLHKRKVGTLFGRGAVVLRDFVTAAGAYLALGLPVTLISLAVSDVEPNLNLSVWLMFLPLAIVAIAIQTLSEELVFRGYFLQQMAARFRSPLAWMILPSLLFGSLHYNPELPAFDAACIVALTTLFGLIAADLTARTGSIGAAWGFHCANNMMAMLLLSVDGTLTGLSLFKTDFAAQDGLPPAYLVGDVMMILAGWWLMRRMLRR